MSPTPTTPPAAPSFDALRLIRAGYLEMPGLRLTLPQARRFWGLDDRTTSCLLDALVAAHFLTMTGDGAFVRADAA